MNCCGNKRTEWARQQQNEPAQYIETQPEMGAQKEVRPRQFEYTGRSSLRLEGVHTRQTYHFRFPGDRLEVDYYDSFAFMAEPALQVLK